MQTGAPAEQVLQTIECPYCLEPVKVGARKCGHCRSSLGYQGKSNGLAFALGVLFGPAGLWYKGNWAAGFAWLAIAIAAGVFLGPFAAMPIWLGMALHAFNAKPRF